MATYYMGIDQGTTGTTVMILDGEFTCVAKGYREHTQYYPQPGWMEHDPAEIMEKIREALDNGTFAAFRNEYSVKLGRRI